MRNILIIGASSGIGLELAGKLKEKNNIFAMSRSRGELSESENIKWKKFDVLNDELDTDFLPDHLDGLVYCPGSINLKPFRGIKVADVMSEFELNALGAFKVIQAVLPKLKKSEGASVVLFSTVAVRQGMPYHSSIGMAKGAVEGMTRSLAAEFAPSIRVNAIAPSLTDTPLANRLLSSDERRDSSAQRHPLKRVGTPADIASMAKFLLSDEASWITGQIMAVDGGMSALKI
jgi:NAD(P)-dependent dehydrogenase (short-subunit alcohol dehydrogenase family)